MENINFDKIRAILDKYPKLTPGSTVKLLNEDDPNSPVVVVSAKGSPLFFMTQEDWDALQNYCDAQKSKLTDAALKDG